MDTINRPVGQRPTDKRPVGLHVRLKNGLLDVVTAVQDLDLPVVQSFFLNEAGSYVQLAPEILHKFIKMKKKLNFSYFVHAAYWSSLVKVNSKEFITLKKEAEVARDLYSEGIVIHIGATRARLDKKDQVGYVAESINELLTKVDTIPLILENSPHAGRNFGGDIDDFALLFEQIEDKNRVKFCLDSTHAFVFGYDLANPEQLQKFFTLIQDAIGKNRIALLHLNDAPEPCGSYIDKHAAPGDGLLGQKVLTQIMHHDLFLDSPIILELPGSSTQKEDAAILQQVRSWD
jgi:deoxyribonuclease IV